MSKKLTIIAALFCLACLQTWSFGKVSSRAMEEGSVKESSGGLLYCDWADVSRCHVPHVQ